MYTFPDKAGRACGLMMALQNEYAQILAKRVNEEKAKKTELRSELASLFWCLLNIL